MQLVLLSALFCSSLTTGVAGLEIQKLIVPTIADPRWESIPLRCEYDLGGKELYSVTWNKDGQEIFRFMPGSPTPKRPQNISGLYIDLNQSDQKQVTLLGPTTRKGKVDLAGSYGCEVSSEAPSFETDYREANMSVAVPPKSAPVLEGLRPSYKIGEILQAECTSGLSYPPAVLTFILNDEEVNRASTKDLRGGGNIDGRLVSTTRLGLTIRLEREHFSSGSLTVVCQSTLPGIANFQPLKTIEFVALAASNQRLAQEPPKSGSRSNMELFPFLTRWTIIVIHVIHYDRLLRV